MTEYAAGHVKRNDETGAVAIRTVFPEDDPALVQMAWLISTSNIGARHTGTSEVDSWTDLFTPPNG